MRKAQIKMFETIGVLIVFFFLLVAGAAFYFNIQESALKKELAKQAELQSLQSAQRAMFLPELDCSFVSVQRDTCFDRLKLHAFQEVTETEPRLREAYFGIFGHATVVVRQRYPLSEMNVTLYHNPPEEYTKKLVSFSPVLLYDSVTKEASFGVMEVTTYASR
jgi:hypothetical protein